jgi:hypothetical protein
MSNGIMVPGEFETELATVWFCANYYYQASYKARREYCGVVFKQPSGKFGSTIRRDGNFSESRIRTTDVPLRGGNDIVAAWHTHLPYTALGQKVEGKLGGDILEIISAALGASYEDFSSADKRLAQTADQKAKEIFGHGFAFYLVTATLIRRYAPSRSPDYKAWPKDPPSKMRGA